MSDLIWRPWLYGGTASVVSELATFPIDTIKTRLQIQGQKIDEKYSQLRYRGTIDALIQITKKEGVKALYSGVKPAVLRQTIYGSIKIGSYYTLKEVAAKRGFIIDKSSGKKRVWWYVIFGTAAGVIASATANPTDVLKVRMQVNGNESRHHGLIASFREIYVLEGIRGLWRGVGPNAQRAAITGGVSFPLYDYLKQSFMKSFGGDTLANHFISSVIVGFASCSVATPFDMIRTRLMNQKRIIVADGGKTGPPKIYKGSLDCVVQTIRNEGVRALYKGFIPTWVRMGPWNVIFFVAYEQLKRFH